LSIQSKENVPETGLKNWEEEKTLKRRTRMKRTMKLVV
jgi:hypothetical protein